MTDLKFHWFLPTNGGDGRQIARSAERLGFEAALTPTGAWITTAMLSGVSERLKFLVAFRPGLTSPFLAAQMAGTFQNLSGGRLLLNAVTGGESHEQRMYGDFLDKDARYERCGEFLEIVRALRSGKAVARRGLWRHPAPSRRAVSAVPFGAAAPAAKEAAS
jgi:alkanesulfonate monooxygenase